MNRRVLLAVTAGGALFLVPWTLWLAVQLPNGYTTYEWRLAWVGFDVLLLTGLACSAWLGLRRRRAAVPVLNATAALLGCRVSVSPHPSRGKSRTRSHFTVES
ncbi:hypothetical protein [Nocardia panacis]|uniref:hypothetical protein n=1 Tax=Nocardia panacis TaxID=2340916 RepID=UPI0011C4A3FF|nr:hypothetical protein [Nocardia panacis]